MLEGRCDHPFLGWHCWVRRLHWGAHGSCWVEITDRWNHSGRVSREKGRERRQKRRDNQHRGRKRSWETALELKSLRITQSDGSFQKPHDYVLSLKALLHPAFPGKGQVWRVSDTYTCWKDVTVLILSQEHNRVCFNSSFCRGSFYPSETSWRRGGPFPKTVLFLFFKTKEGTGSAPRNSGCARSTSHFTLWSGDINIITSRGC